MLTRNGSEITREPIRHGDRVTANRDIETTQGLYVPQDSQGTVAEDRGSTLGVFFHHQTPPSNIDEHDDLNTVAHHPTPPPGVRSRRCLRPLAGTRAWSNQPVDRVNATYALRDARADSSPAMRA